MGFDRFGVAFGKRERGESLLIVGVRGDGRKKSGITRGCSRPATLAAEHGPLGSLELGRMTRSFARNSFTLERMFYGP
jgi:hypothetical protein